VYGTTGARTSTPPIRPLHALCVLAVAHDADRRRSSRTSSSTSSSSSSSSRRFEDEIVDLVVVVLDDGGDECGRHRHRSQSEGSRGVPGFESKGGRESVARG
jgi:hypothetical protein